MLFELPCPVIDAHIHPFLDVTDSIGAFGAPTSLEDFFRELKRCNFTKVCGSVIRKKSPILTLEHLKETNDTALELAKLYKDFYIPGIHVHADFPEESCKMMEEFHAAGGRWVGELVPYALKTGDYEAEGMKIIYETAASLGLPVNIHCTEREKVAYIAENFPKLKLVLAHPEDVGNAKLRFEMVKKYPNLYMDICGTGLFRWNMLRYAIDLCGKEKFLFGSDYPVCSPGMNLGGVLAEHLTEEEQECVFYKNFLSLTGLAL